MKEVEGMLSEDEKSKINDALTNVETVLVQDDVTAIQKAAEELFKLSGSIQEAKSKVSQQAEAKANDDGVVDAEFTEVKN